MQSQRLVVWSGWCRCYLMPRHRHDRVDRDGVLRETMRSAAALTILVFVFTFTFGLAGMALLWARAQRGLLAWTLTGAVAGAMAGLLFGAFAMGQVSAALVVAFALGGWAILLLVRRFAGVGGVAPPA